MASCPICHHNIEVLEQNRGALFNCASCGGVFFIGWDGQPELSGEPTAEQPSAETVVGGIAELSQAPEEPFMPTPGASMVDLPSLETAAESPLNDIVDGPVFGESEKPFEDFADVREFGNAPQASGNMSYTLHLRGVELTDSLAHLREALSDARFGWNVDELMSQVLRTGELTLKSINPTKAAILVGRIQFLPIEIEWRQEVFNGSV